MPVVVLLGAPGAGKGTQAPLLAKRLQVPVLASGDLLRTEVATGSELGREVQEIMRSGELVPDDTIVRLFLHRLGRPDDVIPMVLLLASPLSSWTTGQVVSVNGGYAMV